jgi:hypothetical protein
METLARLPLAAAAVAPALAALIASFAVLSDFVFWSSP